jgi:hypothetical protein
VEALRWSERRSLVDFWALVKVPQTALLLLTGLSAYVLTRGLPFDPLEAAWLAAGLLLSIGGCTVLNMLLDRILTPRWGAIRACHNRRVEVCNERLDRWEEELLDDLTATVPLPLKLRVAFTGARKVRTVEIALGWLMIRLPETGVVLFDGQSCCS